MHDKMQLGGLGCTMMQLGELGCTIKCSWVSVKMQLGQLGELGCILKCSSVSWVSWVA